MHNVNKVQWMVKSYAYPYLEQRILKISPQLDIFFS